MSQQSHRRENRGLSQGGATASQSEAHLADVAESIINEYGDELDPNCRMSLANFMNKAPKERSGVKSNLTSALGLWANPVIDAATSRSDFSFENLRRQPTSIYVGVKQNQLQAMAPLIRLFFQQCVSILGRDLPGPDETHEVLLLIDEFASLGRMEVIESALAFLAGYKVRLVLIVQGLGQLQDLYGKGAENILQNSAVQVFFAANDETTATYVSRRLGTKTITVFSQSDPGGFNWMTKTTSAAARALMLPEQIRQLKDSKEILFKEGARPVMADKIRYYKDRAFKSRLLPPMAVPRLDIKALQPRTFNLSAARGGRRHYGDEGEGLDTMQHSDEAAAASELAAMGHQLAALLDEESAGAADELKAARADLESDAGALPEHRQISREADE